MALEIERKFKLKDSTILQDLQGKRLVQAYLSDSPATVRLRIHGDAALLTIKGPSVGAVRAEFEYPIPAVDALAMLGIPGVTKLEKTRYVVEANGFAFEIDEYHGELAGLHTVEVELPHADTPVELPSWVGEELTGLREWDNSALARFGKP